MDNASAEEIGFGEGDKNKLLSLVIRGTKSVFSAIMSSVPSEANPSHVLSVGRALHAINHVPLQRCTTRG